MQIRKMRAMAAGQIGRVVPEIWSFKSVENRERMVCSYSSFVMECLEQLCTSDDRVHGS